MAKHARAWVAAIAFAGSACGVRAPSRIDLAALVRSKGPVEARRSLEVRIVASPGDVQARLALAALADEQGRPSQAIEHLEAVLRIGGPVGTRWHDDDRARLGKLLAARGRVRLARNAPSAERDLVRAREYGAQIDEPELRAAKRAVAIAKLRHVDGRERAAGREAWLALAELSDKQLEPRDRGELGKTFWSLGAKRAAFEELGAWHAATTAPRDPALVGAYLEALAWWTPVDGKAPSESELVGSDRCRFAAARCSANLAWDDARALDALVAGPSQPTADPDEASVWVALALREALRGRGSWGALLAARVDLANLDERRVKAFARAAIAQLRRAPVAGEPHIAEPDPLDRLAAPERLVVAAARALRGATQTEVVAALGPLVATAEGKALVRVVGTREVAAIDTPRVAAVATYAAARSRAAPRQLAAIAQAYVREPGIAERLGRDFVDTAADAAVAYAALGAIYDGLGDPARARDAWQRAVDESTERELQRGLAAAIARANDPDAALVVATAAAAASGDPAVVWLEVARSLQQTGEHVHALEAARYAIDLGDPATYRAAIDVALDANRALGRSLQIVALEQRRAAGFDPVGQAQPHDPTDARAALAEPSNVDRLWIAARWNARDVELRSALLAALPVDDPRRRGVIAELVALAGDADPDLGRRAIAALPR